MELGSEVVRFPGLGMTFEFSKIAFTIFGIAVYKYAVCIVLGIVVALILAKLSKEKFEIDFPFVLESSIIAIRTAFMFTPISTA